MDRYKITITRQAREHLLLIREYVAVELNEPESAKKLLGLIKCEILSLQTMPYRIKCIDEEPWCDLGFRKLRVKNYYIYFLIDEQNKEIQLLAVIYVKRNQDEQLESL